MKLIIDIDEQEYNLIQSLDWKNGELGYDKCWIAVHNGTPLPKGHGRLIDADKFDVICLTNKSDEFVNGVEHILEQIDNAPTIIEADKE